MAMTISAPRLGFGGDDGRPSRLDAALAAFEEAWRRGLDPRPEDWLGRLDPARPAEATELIYHAFCLAESDGLGPEPADYLARFPAHRSALSRLFELHALASSGDFASAGPAVADHLPVAGDEIGPYYLVRELGRGGFARVFLAEQADLDGRSVVVKVTTRPSPEPKLLARARHPHIVEVLTASTSDDGMLQVVCMPFLGGATLAAVVAARGGRPRSRGDLLARLDRASAPEYPASDQPRPSREVLARASHPRAVAWIFARLAEALDHAYRRGVAHGDIKPTNILLTADAVPMLFDFNLAVDRRDEIPAGLSGGTLAYMPPERLRALADASAAEAPLDRHRADLYALGLVLVEALTGASPAVPASEGGSWGLASALAEARAGGVSAFPGWDELPIPAGLRSILAHCLAADPADRYADGRALAEDLDRWRSDLAPVFAPDAAWPARAARWARRKRLAIAAGVVTLAAASAAAAAVGAAFRSTLRDEARARYDRFVDKDDHGLFGFRTLASWSPRGGDPADLASRKLHFYDIVDDADWRRRDDVTALAESDRADLEILMLEQVYRLARAWADRPNSEGDWRRALALADRECSRVPAPALVALRDELRSRLGLAAPAAEAAPMPVPGWADAYLAGVAAEPLRARGALGHYERAIAERPDLVWPRYRAAAAGCRIALYSSASKHLRAAISRRPDNPALHTHLATALLMAGHLEEAAEECDRALAIEPDFAEAYRTRAIIDDRLARGALRRADGDRFALLTRFLGPAQAQKLDLHSFLHEMLGHRRGGDSHRDRLVREIVAVDPANPEARLVEANTLAGSGRLAEAVDRLDAVLRDRPEHLLARYNRAIYLRRLGRPETLAEYEAVIADPRFEELYREQPGAIQTFWVLAEDLIGLGRLDDAVAVAERGLAESERTGLYPAESQYCLARARAASAGTDPDRLDRARERLRLAVDLRPDLVASYAKDRIFAELRRIDPTFLNPAVPPGATPPSP